MSTSMGKEKLIGKPQFYQTLADAIASRLLSESDRIIGNAAGVLDAATVCFEVAPEFGETQLKMLCSKFGLCYSEAKNAYREYKDSYGKVIPAGLRKVINLVEMIPVSTAECERGLVR